MAADPLAGEMVCEWMSVISFAGAVIGGSDNLVLGVTKTDALFCTAILVLIAIWLQIATIHHMMLEPRRTVKETQ